MFRIKNITTSALCAALIALLAQIILPLPGGVPLTMQTLGIAFCGFYLGYGRGCAVVAVYLLLGATGLPVFSGFSGGFSALIGPAGGYLWGFLPMVFLCGIKGNAPYRLGLGALGLLLCHGSGLLWYSFSTHAGIGAALLTISLPTLWKDALCLPLALWISTRLKKILIKK